MVEIAVRQRLEKRRVIDVFTGTIEVLDASRINLRLKSAAKTGIRQLLRQ